MLLWTKADVFVQSRGDEPKKRSTMLGGWCGQLAARSVVGSFYAGVVQSSFEEHGMYLHVGIFSYPRAPNPTYCYPLSALFFFPHSMLLVRASGSVSTSTPPLPSPRRLFLPLLPCSCAAVVRTSILKSSGSVISTTTIILHPLPPPPLLTSHPLPFSFS